MAKDGEVPQRHKVFINADTSPKTKRVAMLARRAKYLLTKKGYTDKSVTIRRADSRIYVDSTPCIQPTADSPNHAYLHFMGNTFTLAEANIIREEFDSNLGATGGGEEWF